MYDSPFGKVDHGGLELYATKTAALGEDPLRSDADPDRLWLKVRLAVL